MKKYLIGLLAFVLAGSLLAGFTRPPVALAQAKLEPYVLGYLTDITGVSRVMFAPILEGYRAYIEELNAKGGIKGHPVKLLVEDHRNDPGRAVALAKKLIVEDKALALLCLGMTLNHPPVLEEAKKVGVPIINGLSTGLVTFPPNPEKLVFTTNWLMHKQINALTVNWTVFTEKFGIGKKGTRVAILDFDVPGSRAGGDHLDRRSKEAGMEVVYRGVTPPGTLDLTAWAIKIAEAKPDIFYHNAGLSEFIYLIPALEKFGFKGTVITGLNCLEADFSKATAQRRGIIKDVYEIDRYVRRYKGIEKDIPEYGKMVETVKKYGQEFPVGHNHANGWVMGMITEKALNKVGWPATRGALLNVLETLEVDTRGLTGGPIRYSPTDHHGPSWWRAYKWDIKTNEPVVATDWWEFKLEQYIVK
jgi:branched-chain amino acid transport system substrate-binding protein